MTKSVLAIGNCSYDHGNLSTMIRRHFDAEVTAAARPEQALKLLAEGSFDLVLVNRVLEADGGSGVDLIGRIKSDASLAGVPVMLVSNYADAQAEAVAAGAAPGFGKKALDLPDTIDRLRAFLE